MTPPLRLNRDNLVHRQSEFWKPPAFVPLKSPGARAVAFCRRFLDLQAGSIWNDLKRLLPGCQGVVLDVGCGAQPYRTLVPSECRYVGIDSSYARDRFGYEIPETIYYSGDVWPLEDNFADVTLCTETLEHVPHPGIFLQQLHRTLKPGGQAILTIPFAARWHYIPHDYWRFTPSALKLLLSSAGFTSIAVHARGNAVTVACYKLLALLIPLLHSENRSAITRAALLLPGLLLSPVTLLLAAMAQLSLAWSGDDCLGYTVIAVKPADSASPNSGSSLPC